MQDPVAIDTTQVPWTQGRVAGFIRTGDVFEEPSGNLAHKVVCMFEDFGRGAPYWRSIDEYYRIEATLADFDDARMGAGRWHSYGPLIADLYSSEQFLDEVEGRLLQEDFEILRLPEAMPLLPNLKLVPAWETVITYDAFMDEEAGKEDERRREEDKRRIPIECSLCASDKKLYLDDDVFYQHRTKYGAEECRANSTHRSLGTKARKLPGSKISKAHYEYLQGYLQEDNRFNSSPAIVRAHSAYEKLVKCGKEAVPFILRDLGPEEIDGVWPIEALGDLVGQRGGDVDWWIDWGIAEGIL